ncbi:MAG: class I mannose-6-phosphate isomerase [Bacteroidales bacterium]|nr:class I mannose-6-phosphate isomerase [Bacteroidales bacterium]
MPKPQPIYIFDPILKSTIWGGDAICRFKGISDGPTSVGESWEISDMGEWQSIVAEGPERGVTLHGLVTRYGEQLVGRRSIERYGLRFPLLVKFIDADRDLSLQVHPGDEMAMRNHASPGKVEMWYVIGTRGDAAIYAGFNRPMTPATYTAMTADKSIMQAVTRHDVAPGDTFYLPSGRVHAIGAGTFLAEIQQASDITYRIYDYDRLDSNGVPRQLHTELAREAIDFGSTDCCRLQPGDGDTALVSCEHFRVSRLTVAGHGVTPQRPHDTFAVLMCIDGQCSVDGRMTLRHGATALIPAASPMPRIEGNATLLMATL